MRPNSLTVGALLCQGLGRKERSGARRAAGTCHRTNGTEVMDQPALPDAPVILLRLSRRGSKQSFATLRNLEKYPCVSNL